MNLSLPSSITHLTNLLLMLVKKTNKLKMFVGTANFPPCFTVKMASPAQNIEVSLYCEVLGS